MKNTILNFFERDIILNKREEYHFEPCEILKTYVKEFMFIECKSGFEIETLPSTSVSLDFILRGNITMRQEDSSYITLPRGVSFGITRKPFQFKFADNTVLFVVILKPGYAISIINRPINELFEVFVPLKEIFGARRLYSLWSKFKKQNSFDEIVKSMEDFLVNEMELNHCDKVIKEAITSIEKELGFISIKSLIDELPMSRNSFEKKFKALVGTTPKQFSNIVRFRNLFGTSESNKNLTEIGLDAGYYDQSHFIKDFKSFTGKTPSEYYKELS